MRFSKNPNFKKVDIYISILIFILKGKVTFNQKIDTNFFRFWFGFLNFFSEIIFLVKSRHFALKRNDFSFLKNAFFHS